VLAPQHRMVPYPADADDDGDGDAAGRRGVQRWPLDVALTHFHLAMVFADRLHVICTVNQQLVYEDHYDQVGPRYRVFLRYRSTVTPVTVWERP